MKKLLFLLVVVLFFSCKQEDEKNNKNELMLSGDMNTEHINKIVPLINDIAYPEDIITVKSDEQLSYETKSGTEISVPENTFVDKSGNDIKGDVVVKYKEFKTVADIIFNDLDMKYDSGGITYDFKTAGMFNIEAYKNGEPVFIKEGKGIEVNFASEVEGDYNFYKYDKGNWVYQEPIKAEVIVERRQIDNVILKPVKLDTKRDLIIDIPSSYKHLDELKDYRKIIWKYSGDLDYDNVRIILSKRVINPELLRSKKSGIYNYKFKQGDEERILEIAPVFTGKAYVTAVKRFNNTINNGSGNMRVRRSVRITELGLMNYDIISKQDDAIFVKCNFYIIEDDENKQMIENPVFHIAGDGMVIKQRNGATLGYSKSFNNLLIAILPGNKVAVMNSKEFYNTMFGKRKGDNAEFILSEREEPIKSVNDLESIISTL